MSVTKLKTIGRLQAVRWYDGDTADVHARTRGKVIIGLLSRADPDGPAVEPDPRTPRPR